MSGKIRTTLENWFAAAAFAEADDHRTAKDMMKEGRAPRKEARKEVRREKRVELKAD
jgi:hypothetical protein